MHHSQYLQIVVPQQNHTQSHPNVTAVTSLGVGLMTLPLLLTFGVAGYRRYQIRLRNQKIQVLEKLWRITTKERKF